MFLGLSAKDVVSKDMIKSMAKNPIIFACANPDPEINYDLACSVRDDIIMATGRSDNPNQVNNVLGFPFIFRGALDVRASKINEEMKLAAVKAIAELAKKPVPEQVNIAYKKRRLSYGKDYIIPKPFDPRLIEEIPIAVAKAAISSGVSGVKIDDWEKYRLKLSERTGGSQKTIRLIHDRAKQDPKKIIFADYKLHDIPNTCASAIKAIKDLKVNYLTIHISSGLQALKAAKEVSGKIKLVGVSILTSLDDKSVKQIGFSKKLKELVKYQAKLASKAKLDAMVCSPLEIKLVKKTFRKEIITPGIRFKKKSDDQKRIMSPKEAFKNGSDWLVIGRPITQGNIKKNFQNFLFFIMFIKSNSVSETLLPIAAFSSEFRSLFKW